SSDYDALWHCTPNYNMSVPYGDKRILIAVLDSGLDPTFHPDIFAGQRPDHRLDAYGHGTAVSGVILHEAYRQDKLASVYIKSFSVLGEDGTGKLSDLVALMGGPVTKDGYDIVNMSLGYQPLACDVSNTTAISSSLQELDQAGTFIVTSAGNNEQDLGASPQYPAAEPGLIYGITVGSLTCGDPERAQFSNFGSPEVDYLAPGEEILVPNATDNLFRCAKGTSFSAPLVTGMIAGYLSQEYSPDEVICLLRSGATAKGETDSNYGWAAAVDATTVCPEQPEYPDTPDDNEAEVLAKNLRVTTSNLELFPNPAHNVLRVNLPKQQELSPGTLQILDARGVPVLNPGYLAAGDNIDVSSLQPGIYFVRYQAEGQSLVQRFLKH
ncbi:MAG: S8 family peptidase, partial [Bacteroidota bacterium]